MTADDPCGRDTGLHVRRATPGDAPALLAIYAPIVENTTISFETTAPSPTDFAERIATANRAHAWLVAERDGRPVGYAYATSHRARRAYRFSVEVSVYVHEAARGSGVGSTLYTHLFEDLAGLGYYQAYAGITLPNPDSVRLHERLGFRHAGTLPSVGFKFGAWRDVGWWHRPLRSGVPDEVTS